MDLTHLAPLFVLAAVIPIDLPVNLLVATQNIDFLVFHRELKKTLYTINAASRDPPKNIITQNFQEIRKKNGIKGNITRGKGNDDKEEVTQWMGDSKASCCTLQYNSMIVGNTKVTHHWILNNRKWSAPLKKIQSAEEEADDQNLSRSVTSPNL